MVTTRCKPLGAMFTVSASVAATVTFPALTDFFLIESPGHDVSMTFDGTTPTATLGFTIHKDTVREVYIGPEVTVKIFAKSDDPAIMIQPFRKLADVNT